MGTRFVKVAALFVAVVFAACASIGEATNGTNTSNLNITGNQTSPPAPEEGAYQSDVLGGFLTVFASLINILGVNAQKHSHTREDARPKEKQRHYAKRKIWWLGMLGVLSGAMLDMVAVGLANPALVVALGGSASLSGNVIVAKFWQKENLSKNDVTGIGCVIVGAVIIAIKAKKTEFTDIESLLGNFQAADFLVYCGVLAFALFVSLACVYGSSADGFVRNAVLRLVSPVVLQIKATEKMLKCHVHDLERRMCELEKKVQYG